MTSNIPKQENSPLAQIVERFKAYICARNNASAWWNDRHAYDSMRWVEEFEKQHCRPDAEALAAVPELKGKSALVLYFANDQDRREFSALIQEAKPGMLAVNI